MSETLDTVDIKQLAWSLWRWSWLVVVCAIVSGGAAYALSKQLSPTYEAATTLLVQAPAESIAPDYDSLLASERLARTYAEMVQQRPIQEAVIDNLDLDLEPRMLDDSLRVQVIRDTQLIQITVEASTARRAAEIANEIARVFIEQTEVQQARRNARARQTLQRELRALQQDIAAAAADLEALEEPRTSSERQEQEQLTRRLQEYEIARITLLNSLEQIRLSEAHTGNLVSVVEPASRPTRPASPRTTLHTLLAAFVGAMLAAGVVVLREFLDDTLRAHAPLEHLTGLSVLAEVPRIKGTRTHARLLKTMAAQPSVWEACYTLSSATARLSAEQQVQTVLVTSSSPGEGKTTIAASLAAAMVQSGQHVILVDMNLRQPALHTFFGLDNRQGVSTLLADCEAAPDACLLPTAIERLMLLPGGPPVPGPGTLLSLPCVGALLQKLQAQADIVLLDSPALLAVSDAALLARASDAVLLVAMAGRTRTARLVQAQEHLAQTGARVAGLVLNRVPLSHWRYRDYRHYAPHKGGGSRRERTSSKP